MGRLTRTTTAVAFSAALALTSLVSARAHSGQSLYDGNGISALAGTASTSATSRYVPGASLVSRAPGVGSAVGAVRLTDGVDQEASASRTPTVGPDPELRFVGSNSGAAVERLMGKASLAPRPSVY